MKPLITALFIQSLMLIAMALVLIFISLRPAQAQDMNGIFTIPPKVEVIVINNAATVTVKHPVRLIQPLPAQGWRNSAYNTNKPKTFNKGIYTVPRLRIKDIDLE